MRIINIKQVNKALQAVTAEMQDLGFWTPQLDNVSVELHPFFWWSITTCGYYKDKRIVVPAFTFHNGGSLRWVLRHEFGHALVDAHRPKLQQVGYLKAFASLTGCGQEHMCHVSSYATTDPEEDFCETLHVFIRRRGRIMASACSALRHKWECLDRFRRVLHSR